LYWENVSRSAQGLLETDSSFSKKHIYKARVIVAHATATLRSERPNRLDFQVSISVQLNSKSSSFADDNAFRLVNGVKARKVGAWQQELAKDLIDTYLDYFKRQGLSVRIEASKRSKK